MKHQHIVKRILLPLAVLILCGAVLLFAISTVDVFDDTQTLPSSLRPAVLVDAGHGDFDGGAVAPDGTQEKDINLAVSLPLADMLRLCGFRVSMTRDTDTGLHEDNTASIREKKVSDMKKRLELFEESDINISIHQNMFGVTAYYGAQMFYSENHALSKQLAACIRESVYSKLQPDNTRELKTGNRDIYLLYKTTKPTVLVECGFLSNREELSNLKDEAYQRRMAFAIACGVLTYAQNYVISEESV